MASETISNTTSIRFFYEFMIRGDEFGNLGYHYKDLVVTRDADGANIGAKEVTIPITDVAAELQGYLGKVTAELTADHGRLEQELAALTLKHEGDGGTEERLAATVQQLAIVTGHLDTAVSDVAACRAMVTDLQAELGSEQALRSGLEQRVKDLEAGAGDAGMGQEASVEPEIASQA